MSGLHLGKLGRAYTILFKTKVYKRLKHLKAALRT
jgi:hypothetical protein